MNLNHAYKEDWGDEPHNELQAPSDDTIDIWVLENMPIEVYRSLPWAERKRLLIKHGRWDTCQKAFERMANDKESLLDKWFRENAERHNLKFNGYDVPEVQP